MFHNYVINFEIKDGHTTQLKSLACFIRVKTQKVGAGSKNGFEGPTPTPKIRENLDFFLIFSEAVDMANRGHLRSFDVIIGRF